MHKSDTLASIFRSPLAHKANCIFISIWKVKYENNANKITTKRRKGKDSTCLDKSQDEIENKEELTL